MGDVISLRAKYATMRLKKLHAELLTIEILCGALTSILASANS
jgi:hypothetical protein